MPQPPNPTEGQFFTLQPVPPPEPKATTHWGLPLALGLLSLPLLMFGFGFSQQQTPASTAAANPTATPAISPLPTPSQASQQEATRPQPEAAAISPLAPSAVATPLLLASLPSDPTTFPIAPIQSPGLAANFRAAPSLQSAVLGVLMHGDLIELPPDRRVQQDGVVWVPVRWQGQTGWLASNFLGVSTHAQP
ncbi:SH3 domain-containing protein [Phormidium sp. FACHB-592]|uniref:SH3 domain-containing protein n=1 Tax=Stenomitos frigidus AS-A4 TaxID=2933935 RepID=A0ABV0KRM1_9CYAN|nr:SH3 domain-containing protein [Phormidium sp. FACHB-592]MBD2078302.1 SH3 domain-containing protein [Phormidium sp. FACHB-592]